MPGGFNPGMVPPGVNPQLSQPIMGQEAVPTATPAQPQAAPVQAQPAADQSVVAHKLPSSQVRYYGSNNKIW